MEYPLFLDFVGNIYTYEKRNDLPAVTLAATFQIF